MIFVDTGYLLALLNRRDRLYPVAQEWAAAITEPLITTEDVLWELVNSLSTPADRPKAHLAVNQISYAQDWEVVHASSDLFAVGLRLHNSRNDQYWSLTDCISFHVMHQRDVQQALAYDHHFEQAGFEALLRRKPN